VCVDTGRTIRECQAINVCVFGGGGVGGVGVGGEGGVCFLGGEGEGVGMCCAWRWVWVV
jgi:hypothetical protein